MYKDRKNAEPSETIGDFREGLVRNLFSQLINNRLSELTNSPQPPFVFGFSFYGGTFARTKNAYQSIAQTSAEGQLEGLKALLMENERVKRYGFQQGELDRAKKSIIARLEKSYKDRDKLESARIVGQYVSNYLNKQPIPGIEWQFETTKDLLKGITIKEVSELITYFIHDDNRVITLTGPEKEGLTQATEAQVLALIKEVENAEITAYEDEEIRNSLIEKMPAPGTIVSTTENKELGTKTMVHSNGAKITIKKTDFKNDEILFSAFSPGGTSLYSDEEMIATAFANQGLSQAGIGGLSLTDMSKFMSGKIANVTPFLTNAAENFRGSASPKDLEVLFQMVHLYFTDLNKDEEAFNSFVSKQKSFLGNLMANPNFYFQSQVSDRRQEGNPRYTGFPTAAKYEAADYDLAYKKYQERYADAGDFHFFFVGNVDEEKVSAFAKAYLAPLPGLGSNENFIPTTFREKDAYDKFVVNRGKDQKSSVSIAWREETTYNPDTEMTVKALGEVLTIKLVEKLREEEGGVYGVGARGTLSKITFSDMDFTISFPCGPENVEKLTAAALAEVEKIKKDGVTPEDLAKVKETYLVQHKEQIKTNNFWLTSLVSKYQEDRDDSYILGFEKAVAKLTAKDIQDVAQRFLDDKYFISVLMPEEN